MRDTTYYIEMFDETEPPSRGTPAEFPLLPLDREMFPFEKSTGAAELLAARLEAHHLAEQLVGMPLGKLRAETAIRQPIDVSTFEQQPLPHPSETDETGVRLCDCKCARCAKDDHNHCAAEKKCARREESTKAVIAGMIGEMRGRLHPRGRTVPQATWRELESAMVRFLADATASAV